MKLVFVHDGPLFYDNVGNFYEFAYHELLERYSYIADEISFMMRTKLIEGTKKFTLVPKEVKVVEVPNFKSPQLYVKNKKKAERIIEECIRENDYIVLRSQSLIAQVAMKYIIKYNKHYIVESVGCSWDSYWNHGLLGKIVAPYMYLKTRRIIGHSEFVYYVTTKFLQKRYPTKGKTVSCSNVVVDLLDGDVLARRIHKLKGLNPKIKLIVGTAAAIDTRYKGQEYVIQAINDLLDVGYEIEYWLAGGLTGSKQKTYLQDLSVKCGVQDRVKFIGSLSADKMFDYYDSLDIYIQPSKQEGLPRAVIEAMSRGCPVIGTNIAGIPELIPEECLFKKGRTDAVKMAIARILDMDLENMAIRNFETAKQYDKRLLQEKRKDFYDEFLKSENK